MKRNILASTEKQLEEMITRLKCAKHVMDGQARQQYQQLLEEYELEDVDVHL